MDSGGAGSTVRESSPIMNLGLSFSRNKVLSGRVCQDANFIHHFHVPDQAQFMLK